MDQLTNKFILTHWRHNGGFEDKWLRRINRQTKTQYISDCQRYLICGDEKYMKGIFQSCATRFIISKVTGLLTMIRGCRANADGTLTTMLLDDYSVLDCDYSLEKFIEEIGNYKCTDFNEDDEEIEIFKKLRVIDVKDGDTWYSHIVEHLRDVFGKDIKLMYLLDSIGYLSTTHDTNLIANSAIHYHITIYGENKKIISSEEDRHNRTISFWKFGDVIVFKNESGIGSW